MENDSNLVVDGKKYECWYDLVVEEGALDDLASQYYNDVLGVTVSYAPYEVPEEDSATKLALAASAAAVMATIF